MQVFEACARERNRVCLHTVLAALAGDRLPAMGEAFIADRRNRNTIEDLKARPGPPYLGANWPIDRAQPPPHTYPTRHAHS